MDTVARDKFIELNSLAAHPLLAKGYESIGCTHCTKAEKNRSGRWEGLDKTECGLHL
jgi:phosphoadenosine phosphosulfate reductase